MGQELASQPDCWERAADLAAARRDAFPHDGERVAVIGCGTSWFMAMSYAARREAAGKGLTDAFSGSEVPEGRHYDRYVLISRSGTTSEIVDLLARLHGASTLAITAVPSSPIATAATTTIAMPFADEESVVQTRFATTALALLRASLGEDLTAPIADARAALERDVSGLLEAEQFTFLGRGWAIGLASEGALKMRESAQQWTEAYPSMDYRHGPIAIAQPGRIVWSLDAPPAGLAEQVAATGARLVVSDLDPLAELIVIQRTALALSLERGLDPDSPRHLTRSVMLTGGSA